MKTARIVQAVVLMMVVALAASCAATKEYSSKLFSPRIEIGKDSQATALHFLDLESLQTEKEGWVTTDIIMGRDTVSKTLALDNLAKIFPVVPVIKDTAVNSREEKTILVKAEKKAIPADETKPIPVADHPIAKNYDPTEVRNKKTREK